MQPPSEPPRGFWSTHWLNTGAIVGATYTGVRLLPPALSHAIGRAGTYVAYRTMRETTAALVDNLRAVRPGTPERALQALALETFRSYARDTIEFMRHVGATEAEVDRLIETPSRPHVERVLSEGKGALMLTGHFGSWELGGMLVRRFGWPLTVLTMPEASPAVSEIRRRIRERLGVDTIEVRQSIDTALQIRRRLADGHIVAMLVDRHVDKDRVEVTFCGRRAHFLRTPALLSYFTGAPLVPCFITRQANGRYLAYMEQPIALDRASPRDEAVRDATQRFATLLEERLRATPSYWYQFYRYWDAQREATTDSSRDRPSPARMSGRLAAGASQVEPEPASPEAAGQADGQPTTALREPSTTA
ncbi:MAG: lysophospholipid acyltransferase family protein [Vicinamibacterales bacterium]